MEAAGVTAGGPPLRHLGVDVIHTRFGEMPKFSLVVVVAYMGFGSRPACELIDECRPKLAPSFVDGCR